ncbi:DegT/DnrJ/EryC1/StrS family aminotransferase [Pelagibacterales bacterium SAG-MED49]|nr:DegT/DnrJ/EryC1/StrS family aminotransferase [Pelagibacterales bacterium SAG-MED49]
MSKDILAIFGGKKALSGPLRKYRSIGNEEVEAAKKVIESGNLSEYIGAWGKNFFGGPKVLEFEKAATEFFDVKHAITVNSWTSGLVAAIGSIDIEPGDEVIVTPWTMTATATAILHWNAIPVFADIDPSTYNLSASSIEKCISPHTRAIVVVDIFGQSADMDEIMHLAKKYKLKVISDTAQSPGALYKKKYAGTLADVGGYSLNYHKHIHTGEGGILVTNDDQIAERLQLIRNHAEVVVENKGVTNIANMVGHNFRLGEIECAIGIEQLKKLSNIISKRQHLAGMMTDGLTGLKGLITPKIGANRTHVYYVYAMQLDFKVLKTTRERICKALNAEGVPVVSNYQNIHLLPIYQNKIAFGSKGFPWTSDICKREVSYKKGICPVAEHLNDFTYLGFNICLYDLDENDVKSIITAFKKVWKNLSLLKV